MHLHISLRKSLLDDIMTEKSFNTVPVDEIIYASLDGWWPVFGKFENAGMWTKEERKLHINVFELLGDKLGFLSFLKYNIH